MSTSAQTEPWANLREAQGRAVQQSQPKPSSPTLRGLRASLSSGMRGRIHCPNGHEVMLSRIPWQAGCRLCSDHNGWHADVLAQYYNKVLNMEPLPWHSATSEQPLKVAQFKGKGMFMQAQEAEKKCKGTQGTPPPEPATPPKEELSHLSHLCCFLFHQCAQFSSCMMSKLSGSNGRRDQLNQLVY